MSVTIDRRLALRMALGAAGMTVVPAFAQDSRPTPPLLKAFVRSPLVSNIALSPNGKRVAFTTEVDGDQRLVFFDVAAMEPKTASLGALKLRNLIWTDDEHILYVFSNTEHMAEFGTRAQELYRTRLVDINALKIRDFLGALPRFYQVLETFPQRVRREGKYQIFLNIATWGGTLAVNSDGSVEERKAKETMNHVDGVKARMKTWHSLGEHQGSISLPSGEIGAQLWLRDGDSPAKRTWQVTTRDLKDGYYETPVTIFELNGNGTDLDLIGLGREADSFLVSIRHDGEEPQYHILSRAGALSEPLQTGTGKGEFSALFHPTTWRFCGLARRDDWVHYAYDDPLLKKLVDALPTLFPADYRLSIIEFAEDPRIMIVYGEGPNDAGSYYHVDFTNGGVVELPQNYPDIPRDWIAQKQPIDYSAADGTSIHAYLTLPPHREAKNLPLVVLPHGGPHNRDYGDFDGQAQALASRGYAVLQPNFRGSSGYGMLFSEAGHNEFGRKMQSDLSDGIAHLAGKGTIDRSRVAIVGASYGGYAALAGATLDQGVYRCAVSIAGISDVAVWLDYLAYYGYRGTNSYSVKFWQKYLGDAKGYPAISPAQQADRAYCPILLIHGRDDTVVPFKHSDLMAKALKRAGKVHELIAYDGQDHWETIESSRIDMMQRVVTFLETHNPA